MQNIPPSVSHFLQNLHLTGLESCLFVYRARRALHLPRSLLSLTASVVGIWKSTKILSAARALTRLFTEKRWPSRFPPSSGDNSPRLPLSASQIFLQARRRRTRLRRRRHVAASKTEPSRRPREEFNRINQAKSFN